jgi:hypothetical protein
VCGFLLCILRSSRLALRGRVLQLLRGEEAELVDDVSQALDDEGVMVGAEEEVDVEVGVSVVLSTALLVGRSILVATNVLAATGVSTAALDDQAELQLLLVGSGV